MDDGGHGSDAPKRLVASYLTALETGDLSALDDLFADDVVAEGGVASHVGPGSGQRPVIASSVRALHQGMSEIVIVPAIVMAEGRQVAARWSVTGRHTGLLLGQPATDVEMTFTASGVGEIDADVIVRWTEVWDTVSVLSRLGVLDASEIPPQ